jgi:hypothetical protein
MLKENRMLRHLRRLLEERNQKVINFKLFPPEYTILPEALLVERHNLLIDDEDKRHSSVKLKTYTMTTIPEVVYGLECER